MLAAWHARVVGQGGGKRGNRLGRVLSERPEQARAVWGEVVDVVGVGMACTLIRRQSARASRVSAATRRAVECCDWWLAKDAAAAGFSQRRLRLGVRAYQPHASTEGIMARPKRTGLWRVGAAVTVTYLHPSQPFLSGLPARDMTETEWNEQPADLRALALALDLYQRTEEPASVSPVDDALEPVVVMSSPAPPSDLSPRLRAFFDECARRSSCSQCAG